MPLIPFFGAQKYGMEAGADIRKGANSLYEALYQAKEEARNRVVIKQPGTTEIETGRFRARAAS